MHFEVRSGTGGCIVVCGSRGCMLYRVREQWSPSPVIVIVHTACVALVGLVVPLAQLSACLSPELCTASPCAFFSGGMSGTVWGVFG